MQDIDIQSMPIKLVFFITHHTKIDKAQKNDLNIKVADIPRNVLESQKPKDEQDKDRLKDKTLEPIFVKMPAKSATDTVLDTKFSQQRYESLYKRFGKFFKKYFPNSTIISNYDGPTKVGEFTIYTYGFGKDHPSGQQILFTNAQKKLDGTKSKPAPSKALIYYQIVKEIVKYQDVTLQDLENIQRDYLDGNF